MKSVTHTEWLKGAILYLKYPYKLVLIQSSSSPGTHMRDPVWVLDLGAVDPGSRGAVVVFWVGCSVLAGGCYMTIRDWVRPGDEVFVTRGLEKELVIIGKFVYDGSKTTFITYITNLLIDCLASR